MLTSLGSICSNVELPKAWGRAQGDPTDLAHYPGFLSLPLIIPTDGTPSPSTEGCVHWHVF